MLGALTVCLVISSRQAPIHAAARAGTGRAPTAQASTENVPGAKSYTDNCAICHGDQREGNLPAIPPLTGIGHHLDDRQITAIIQGGKGVMPGNPDLKGDELVALLHFLSTSDETFARPAASAPPSDLAERGGALFQQNCAFCHGRDTMGGESGPDLTQSTIVQADVNGDGIGEVVRSGRPAKKMPAFNFSNPEIEGLAAFIHVQEEAARIRKGNRRGVAVADLQTGDAAAGKQYFDGPGTCSHCHSASGDLAGVAGRFQGLALERRMLYPEGAKSKVTVTLRSGQKVPGTLAYLDEFTVALRDSNGMYRSWPTSRVKYGVDSPVEAHVDLFGKYTDADIHNLMAYLQTLR
jgi:mono/diheme cytochrome c family protein